MKLKRDFRKVWKYLHFLRKLVMQFTNLSAIMEIRSIRQKHGLYTVVLKRLKVILWPEFVGISFLDLDCLFVLFCPDDPTPVQYY